MFNTNELFSPGKLTICMDGGAGSSGKGRLGAWLCNHASHFDGTYSWSFACNAFMSNAAHTIVLDDGTEYVYQSLNSMAYAHNFKKIYICGGAVLELQPLLNEIKINNIKPYELGIHPLVAIVQQKDIDYERGVANFDGDKINAHQADNMKIGSTLHGVGAARARRILRRSDVVLARDVPELKQYICQTDEEIINRLEHGEAGLMEIAQGYSLGYLSRFYPKSTSRNCTVAAGLDDCGIPPKYAGNVVINFRTYPIRVNSNKYVDNRTNAVLTSDDIEKMTICGDGKYIMMYKGDSGGVYDDQTELTWDDITKSSGILDSNPTARICEKSTLTKLERRVFTFSKQNVLDAVRFNATSLQTFISVNFMNYVDHTLTGVRGGMDKLSDKAKNWLNDNIYNVLGKLVRDHHISAHLLCVGTGPKTDDMISDYLRTDQN